jgi:hypothetical protein
MSKFDDFYSKKSVSELLEKLRTVHLHERKLTNDEKNLLNQILSSDAESLETNNEVEQALQSEKRKGDLTSISSGSEGGRYTALKTVTGLISSLGYVVIFVGFGLLIFMLSQNQGFMGFIALVISIVIALPLLAYSNLIQVFIDIEHNTRKTKEIISTMNK